MSVEQLEAVAPQSYATAAVSSALTWSLRAVLLSDGLLKFLWWNVLGFFGWCLFVTGHDCGHRTFSDSLLVCDVLGHICHAPLLVPFNGWRISHRKHHEHHNDVERDHSWRPLARTNFEKYTGIFKIIRFSHALLVLYPAYLIMDSELTSGNHFNPYSRLFAKDERRGAWISALSVGAFLCFLLVNVPLLTLLDAYVAPYIFFVIWLDLVTYLHHTDARLLYYRHAGWSFLKGGLSTMDRSYGSIVDHLHHNIGTHMAHHLFYTRIPHYHLKEATEALKPVLKEHYKFDETPFLEAYVRSKELCHFVEDEGHVLAYHSEQELAKTHVQ
jgi:omega-3 fatty acid desaturase (delta-15 desaturase)